MSGRFGSAVMTLVLAAAPAAAQSSQFGVRGLGIPIQPISVRAAATGGGLGLFDLESRLNPASFALVPSVVASFQTVQSWRTSENPVGRASARDNGFPGVFVAGPVGGTPLAVAVSASGYTDRTFSLASRDTLDLRGVPVEVYDTLSSRGGLTDLRVAVAYAASRSFQAGIGFHVITGSNRIVNARRFGDSLYAGAREVSNISYLGVGLSAGLLVRVVPAISLAALVRLDDRLNVDRDTARIGRTRLPVTLAAGLRVQLSERFLMAGYGERRSWSKANEDLIAQGGIGAENVWVVGGGLELLTNARRPNHRPIRAGVRFGTLPFPLEAGQRAHETGVSIGTGFRFVGDRAGLDLTLERVWRGDGGRFTETATLLSLAVSVRP